MIRKNTSRFCEKAKYVPSSKNNSSQSIIKEGIFQYDKIKYDILVLITSGGWFPLGWGQPSIPFDLFHHVTTTARLCHICIIEALLTTDLGGVGATLFQILINVWDLNIIDK